MSNLIQKNDGATLASDLSPGEIEALRKEGVPVESQSDDGSGQGSDGDADGDQQEQQSDGDGGSQQEQQLDPEPGQQGEGDGQQESGDGQPDQNGPGGSSSAGDWSPDTDPMDSVDEEKVKEQSDVTEQDDSGGDTAGDDDSQAREIAEKYGNEPTVEPQLTQKQSCPFDDRISRAKQNYQFLAEIMRDQLRQERRTRVSRGERHGRFDQRATLKAERGATDVFTRLNKPDEKDYHVVIAYDDSGSMSQPQRQDARQATVELALACEDVGIETTVYAFAHGVELRSTIGMDPSESLEAICQKMYDTGATTLLPVLNQIETLTEKTDRQTVLAVITDGNPNDKNTCKEKLEELRIPSLCLQLENGMGFETQYDSFTVAQSCDNDVSVSGSLKSMFRSEVFR